MNTHTDWFIVMWQPQGGITRSQTTHIHANIQTRVCVDMYITEQFRLLEI